MGTATDLITLGAFGLLIYGVFKSGIFNGLPIPGSGGGSGGASTSTGDSFAAVGDVDCTSATAENVAKGNPALTLYLGDFSYGCEDAEAWWNGPMKAWSSLGKAKTLAALGNHDGDEFLKLFGNPGGKWQSLKIMSGVAFVSVNTEGGDMDELEALLQKAESDPKVKLTVCYMHKTVYLPKAKPLKPDADKGFHSLFKARKKVKMVLGGRNHFYARLKPVDGILYVTAGNGGHNKGSGSKTRGTISNQLGVVKCDIGSGGNLSCKEVLNDGTVIDSWTVSPHSVPSDGEEIDGLNSSDTGDGNNEDDNEV